MIKKYILIICICEGGQEVNWWIACCNSLPMELTSGFLVRLFYQMLFPIARLLDLLETDEAQYIFSWKLIQKLQPICGNFYDI